MMALYIASSPLTQKTIGNYTVPSAKTVDYPLLHSLANISVSLTIQRAGEASPFLRDLRSVGATPYNAIHLAVTSLSTFTS